MISQTDTQIINDMAASNIDFIKSAPCNREDEGMGQCADAYIGCFMRAVEA